MQSNSTWRLRVDHYWMWWYTKGQQTQPLPPHPKWNRPPKYLRIVCDMLVWKDFPMVQRLLIKRVGTSLRRPNIVTNYDWFSPILTTNSAFLVLVKLSFYKAQHKAGLPDGRLSQEHQLELTDLVPCCWSIWSCSSTAACHSLLWGSQAPMRRRKRQGFPTGEEIQLSAERGQTSYITRDSFDAAELRDLMWSSISSTVLF